MQQVDLATELGQRSRDQAQVQPFAGGVHIAINCRGKLLERSAEVEGQDLGVGKGENRFEVERDILGKYALVSDLQRVVLGMPGDVAAAAADAMPAATIDFGGRPH